jgi:hypothetical protein
LAHLGRLDLKPAARRFRVYNVGIAKTGTQSVASIFANYRSLHEYLFADTVDAIGRRASGEMSDAQFRDFIQWRDGVARLDVDSSSFNSFYVDILAQQFADAKFVFFMRDCWSWLDSMLNMVVHFGPVMPEWMVEHCRTILGPACSSNLLPELAGRMPELVRDGLSYWSRANQFVLDCLPEQRSLVLHTSQLSSSLPCLAAFVGVPLDSLRDDLAHVHRAQHRYHLLDTVDPVVLAAGYTADCARLMERFYPTLADNARSMVLT